MRYMLMTVLMIGAASPAVGQAPPDRPGASDAAMSPDPGIARPIAAADELWIERLTWLEVRDAIRGGKTTVIIPTGGVEQNGPYLVTGKHNVILQATAEATARKLGNALVAPIVPFVPEGGIDPPTGSMRYAGTITVEAATYTALLRDIARSMKAHGFKHIIFIGDSGGNQQGMHEVAEQLDKAWSGSGVRAHHVDEYYDWPGRQRWLAARGYKEVDQGIHDELSGEAIMLSVDPRSVRMEQRIAAGKFSINGIALAPVEQTQQLGRELVDHIADITATAIRKRR